MCFYDENDRVDQGIRKLLLYASVWLRGFSTDGTRGIAGLQVL